MSELRRDPVTGHCVIVAAERAKRPIEFQRLHERRTGAECPFCAGQEHQTPAAIARYGATTDTVDGWQVRVVPNKYPILSSAAQALPEQAPSGGTLQVDVDAHPQQLAGVHEVIIESSDHCVNFTEISSENARLVFTAYADRLASLANKPRVAYGLVFKNLGAAAGASIQHLHSQLVATEFVPPTIQNKLDRARQYFARQSACLFCNLLRDEESSSNRIIARSDHFVAFCPFASRFSYEFWVAPREHACRFEGTSPDLLAELAQFMQRCLGGLETALEHPAYNYLIHTAPFDINTDNHYHWHIEVFPRTAEIAGFELATGCFINPTPPEVAAAQLRNATRSSGSPATERNQRMSARRATYFRERASRTGFADSPIPPVSSDPEHGSPIRVRKTS